MYTYKKDETDEIIRILVQGLKRLSFRIGIITLIWKNA